MGEVEGGGEGNGMGGGNMGEGGRRTDIEGERTGGRRSVPSEDEERGHPSSTLLTDAHFS